MTGLPDDVLARALAYPYERPSGSFLFEPTSAAVEPIGDESISEHVRTRTAVLAIGSNASPQQLSRKFRDHAAPGEVIPVVATALSDHDVVFAAMVARYGSIPATMIPSPGTRCNVHLTLLTDTQLERMNETEGVGRAYDLSEVAPTMVECAVQLAGPITAYVARRGPLLVDGFPVALAAIEAEGRRFDAWTEERILTYVASTRGLDLEEFVVSMVGDDEARSAVNAALSAGGGT